MVRFTWVDQRWLKIATAIRHYQVLILSVRLFQTLVGSLNEFVQEEDAGLWQPLTSEGVPYIPAPARIMSSFVALSRLCKVYNHSLSPWHWHRLAIIGGMIINKVYPVQGIIRATKQTILAECEAQLDQWYLGLPDYLQCDPSKRGGPYVPQVIFLHIRYWGCILLLYRALWVIPFLILQITTQQPVFLSIPNWKRYACYRYSFNSLRLIFWKVVNRLHAIHRWAPKP